MFAYINWVAVVVGTVINIALGSAWYSKAVFGKPWMKLVGIQESVRKDAHGGRGMSHVYILMALSSFVISFFLNFFVSYLGARTFSEGIIVGFFVWLGFTAPTMLGEYASLGRSKKLYFINVGYYLVSFVLISGIFAAWH